MADDISESDASDEKRAEPALPPGVAPAMNASDTSFDLSLRLLTALVIFALIGSVAKLVYRYFDQNGGDGNGSPVPVRTTRPAPVAKAPEQGPLHRDEVLMDPGRVFKCEDQGRVTFSDQACTGNAPAAHPPAAAPSTSPGAAGH